MCDPDPDHQIARMPMRSDWRSKNVEPSRSRPEFPGIPPGTFRIARQVIAAKNIFDVYKDEVEYIQNNLNQIDDLSLSLKSTETKLKEELVRVRKTKEALIKKFIFQLFRVVV